MKNCALACATSNTCARSSPTSIRSICDTTEPSIARGPKTQAVMFCLMDVSASMTEDLKDLSKRFFMLLHLFLSRHYNEVDIVFIRHTTSAQEVDEDTFFRATETGGTVISSALDEMLRVVKDRYPVDDWNIYAAQASDGHNFDDDMDRCMSMLRQEILPLCQYYAYIEVYSEEQIAPFLSVVWSGYDEMTARACIPTLPCAACRVPGEIYPVFRELFSARSRPWMHHARTTKAGKLLYDGRMGFRDSSSAPTMPSMRSASARWVSTSTPTRSRSFAPSRCSMPTPRSACRTCTAIGRSANTSPARKGSTARARALAYELVINSDPCINYIMEENTMTMQALVLAHAAMGHNHFFKNNYLFQQWTDATSILDYLTFAKEYVAECEERYGVEAVEMVLDSAHALMNQGISRHPMPRRTAADMAEKARKRRQHEEETYNEIWRTVPRSELRHVVSRRSVEPTALKEELELNLPQENVLYFLEKHAPKLEDWKRELLRIVRMLAQYFYPQRQTKVMNEGCATFVHYEILNTLYDRGQISEGSMLEFMHSHSSVIYQPSFDSGHYGGMNPYALGFAMMQRHQAHV